MAKNAAANPWVDRNTAPAAEPQSVATPRAQQAPTGPTAPQAGTVVAPDGGGLAVRQVRPDRPPPHWWWLGCHGGAGVSTLLGAIRRGADAERAWPVRQGGPPSPVVLVARSHTAGLHAAQAAIQQWASGAVPVHLLGLVVVADAPGRLPRPLRDLASVIAGGAPQAWAVPWFEPWRFGEEVPAKQLPKPVARLASDLFATVSSNPGKMP